MAKFSHYGIQAERLFIEEGKSPEQVSAALKGIFGASAPSEATIDRWRQKYNWEAKRRAFRQGPQGAVATLEGALPKLTSTLEELIKNAQPNSDFIKEANSLVNSIAKLTRAIQSARKDIDPLAAVVFAMGRFSSFVLENEKDESTRERIISLIQGFSNRIAETT